MAFKHVPSDVLGHICSHLTPVELIHSLDASCHMVHQFLTTDRVWQPYAALYPGSEGGTIQDRVRHRVQYLAGLNAVQLNEIAVSFCKTKQHEAADICFQLAYKKVAECDSNVARGQMIHSYAKFMHMVRGEYEIASKLYDEALVLIPSSPQLLASAASLYVCHRISHEDGKSEAAPQPKRAIKLYEQAIKAIKVSKSTCPTKCRVYSGYAYALLLCGEVQKSAQWFEESIRTGDPKYFNVTDLLSYALLLSQGSSGRVEQIDMLYRICIRIAPKALVPNMLYAAYLQWSKKDRHQAMRYFDRVIQLDPSFSTYCEQLQSRTESKTKVAMVITKGREPGCRILFDLPAPKLETAVY